MGNERFTKFTRHFNSTMCEKEKLSGYPGELSTIYTTCTLILANIKADVWQTPMMNLGSRHCWSESVTVLQAEKGSAAEFTYDRLSSYSLRWTYALSTPRIKYLMDATINYLLFMCTSHSRSLTHMTWQASQLLYRPSTVLSCLDLVSNVYLFLAGMLSRNISSTANS